MPRRSRIIVPNIPLHVIQRGNNRQACFYVTEDYQFYLEWLQEYAGSTGCLVHAYVLMTNHVHLLLTPEKCHRQLRMNPPADEERTHLSGIGD